MITKTDIKSSLKNEDQQEQTNITTEVRMVWFTRMANVKFAQASNLSTSKQKVSNFTFIDKNL